MAGKLDGRLRERAQEWLTRKMAYGFFPTPRTEVDFRQRYHVIRELYADGDAIRTELWKVPPHERTVKDGTLFERIEREVEEVRLQQEELRSQAGIGELIERGVNPERVVVEESPNRLEIRIGPLRSGFLNIVLPLGFLMSGILCMNGVLGVFGRGPMPWGLPGGLLVAVPFAALAVFSAHYWLWVQGGSETITVSPAGLKLEGDLLQWHGEKTFRLEEVEHLRYSRPRKGDTGNAVVVASATVIYPTVAFNYEGKIWRFGSELDEGSAHTLIAAIERYLPG